MENRDGGMVDVKREGEKASPGDQVNGGNTSNGEEGYSESDEDPRYDREKYVSRAEYLRDVNALKHKWVKLAFFLSIGIIIGSMNILLMKHVDQDGVIYWKFETSTAIYDMDYIMAYLAVLFVLLIPGIWIGVAKHKLYALTYFGGFSIAGGAFSFALEYIIQGLYVFGMSFVLLLVVYLIFYKMWFSIKKSVARPRYE